MQTASQGSILTLLSSKGQYLDQFTLKNFQKMRMSEKCPNNNNNKHKNNNNKHNNNNNSDNPLTSRRTDGGKKSVFSFHMA